MTTCRYTVVLMRPDYNTSDFGQDAFMAHVFAVSPAAAVEEAQAAALLTDFGAFTTDEEATDYFPIAVFAGHLDDLTPRN